MKKLASVFIFILMTGLFSGVFFSTNLSYENNEYLSSLLLSGFENSSSGFVSCLLSALSSNLILVALMLPAIAAKPLCPLPPCHTVVQELRHRLLQRAALPQCGKCHNYVLAQDIPTEHLPAACIPCPVHRPVLHLHFRRYQKKQTPSGKERSAAGIRRILHPDIHRLHHRGDMSLNCSLAMKDPPPFSRLSAVLPEAILQASSKGISTTFMASSSSRSCWPAERPVMA